MQWLSKHSAVQVPTGDNYYAALNTAVFSDGSFVYIPKGVRCPMELSTYFRINAQESGQVQAPTLPSGRSGHITRGFASSAASFMLQR